MSTACPRSWTRVNTAPELWLMDGIEVSFELGLTLEGLVHTAWLEAFESAIVVERANHCIRVVGCAVAGVIGGVVHRVFSVSFARSARGPKPLWHLSYDVGKVLFIFMAGFVMILWCFLDRCYLDE